MASGNYVNSWWRVEILESTVDGGTNIFEDDLGS